MAILFKSISRSAVLLTALLFIGYGAVAQIKYGFKTGLNFSRFQGTSELDNQGNSLEKWDNSTGFHIGMTFAYKFTDRFGVRGEFLYSKRGAKYSYEGQAYRFFKHNAGQVYTTGNARYLINVNNSYLDIPVMAFGKFKHFEIYGGGYVGILVASTGEGSLRYSGKTALGNNAYVNPNTSETELNFNLNHNYRRDDPGEGTANSDNETAINVKVDGFIAETPKTMGAYYDYPEDKGALYNTLDFGVVGGLSYYISSALYISGRVQYGLSDITNNKADLAKARTGDGQSLIYRDDKDQNFMIQASVGFSF
ncbi:MAG: PorT family protein [Chitinophagales bacterium]|nr:PorT family protein [Chitinophagales bacterium]